MDARSLIETLKGRGLSLYLEGERIKVEAPREPDPETMALLSELRQHREEVKMILAMLHSRAEPIPKTPAQEGQEEGEAEPQATTPEALAVSVLAEIEPDEVGQILRVWKETFGMDLDRDRVTKNLGGLRKWQSRWVG